MRVHCHTNLDLSNEQWPTELPAVPNTGDHIVSRTKHDRFQLELQVCRVRWEYSEHYKEYIPTIELHMSDWMKRLPAKKPGAADGSIQAFYEWYAPLVGRSVGAFL
jgi:hypothetical protein